jgi:outer membrane protein
MRTMTRTLAAVVFAAMGSLAAAPMVLAQPLTADQAVEIALKNSPDIANANANVQDASGSLLGAYSGVLPQGSASLSRSGSWARSRSGDQVFGGLVFPSDRTDVDQYSTTPALSGSWSALNLSALSGLNAARNGLKAARLQRNAARNSLAFNTRRQFYEVVRTIKLAEVADGATTVARDEERRVRALFEVGSVSRSDLLKAQVRTSQSQRDSLTSHHNVTLQRINLASLIGIAEAEMGQVDTSLAFSARDYDEASLLAEATKNRPDLLGAQSQLRSAEWAVRAA